MLSRADRVSDQDGGAETDAVNASDLLAVKSPAVCLRPGLFLNVRKIRVDSGNKR